MTLLYFWATWCIVCKPGLTTKLPNIMAKFPNLKVTAVCIEEDSRRAKHFVKKWKIKIPVDYTLNMVHKRTSAPYWKLYKSGKLLDESSGFNIGRIENHLIK